MNKRDALRLNDVALNILDLVHCLHTGSANEISFDAWKDMFARGKDYEAARKQWQRWKGDLERHGLIERVEDGREDHVILKPEAVEIAEALHAQAQAVLEEGKEEKRTYPDHLTFDGRTFHLKVYGRDIPLMDDRQYAELKASIATNGIDIDIEVDRRDNVVDGKTRLTCAHELGLSLDEIPIHVREETDPAVLERLAAELNDNRRHYNKHQLAERRRRRQESARAKRADGKSTWQIAEEEGVSQRTVREDIKGAAEDDGPVLGKDGKRRSRCQSTEEKKAKRRASIKELLAGNPLLTVRELVEELGYSTGTICGDIRALAAMEQGRQPESGGLAPGSAIVVGRDVGSCVLGVDPEDDDLRPCLEAALSGVELLRETVRGTDAAAVAEGVHKIIDTLIWRLVEQEAP